MLVLANFTGCARAGAEVKNVMPHNVSEHSRSRTGVRTNTRNKRARYIVAIGNWNSSFIADLPLP
jgi:hypothetical protein